MHGGGRMLVSSGVQAPVCELALRPEQVSSFAAPHSYWFETGSVMEPEAVLAKQIG